LFVVAVGTVAAAVVVAAAIVAGEFLEPQLRSFAQRVAVQQGVCYDASVAASAGVEIGHLRAAPTWVLTEPGRGRWQRPLLKL
jgi:hypothetical protein